MPWSVIGGGPTAPAAVRWSFEGTDQRSGASAACRCEMRRAYPFALFKDEVESEQRRYLDRFPEE